MLSRADCDDERDLLWLCEAERDLLSLSEDARGCDCDADCEDERERSLCEAERDFGSAMAGAAEAGVDAGDEFSRLLAGLPGRVCDGADGADLDADLDADGADCEAVATRLSDLPGEITLGSGYTDGGATSWTMGFASQARASRESRSDFSDLLAEISFGAG